MQVAADSFAFGFVQAAELLLAQSRALIACARHSGYTAYKKPEWGHDAVRQRK